MQIHYMKPEIAFIFTPVIGFNYGIVEEVALAVKTAVDSVYYASIFKETYKNRTGFSVRVDFMLSHRRPTVKKRLMRDVTGVVLECISEKFPDISIKKLGIFENYYKLSYRGVDWFLQFSFVHIVLKMRWKDVKHLISQDRPKLRRLIQFYLNDKRISFNKIRKNFSVWRKNLVNLRQHENKSSGDFLD